VELAGGKQQAVLLGLCRIDPALDYDYKKRRPGQEVGSALGEAFGAEEADDILVADSLGRWDVFLAARLPGLDFSPAGRLRDVAGLKKLDLQYGYGDRAAIRRFSTTCTSKPFMLVTYLHIRDDLSLRAPGASHGAVQAQLAVACAKARQQDFAAVALRLLGWPDYAVVAAGRDLEQLTLWARDCIWALPVSMDLTREEVQEEAARLEIPTKRWPLVRNDGSEAVFSRTFSTLCVVDPFLKDDMCGQLHSLQVDFRVRSGADAAVAEALVKQTLRDRIGISWYPRLQPGCTDVSALAQLGDGGVEARTFIPWYFGELMPRLKDLVTTSEMRIGVPVPARNVQHLSRKMVLPGVRLPASFLAEAEKSSAGEAVGACVRALQRSLNSMSVNDGMYGSCADLHLYGLAFSNYLEASMKQRKPRLARLMEEAGTVSSHFSTAMGQRLRGSYYDLTADKPEGLVEHVGGRQKPMIALWGLQEALLASLRRAINQTEPTFGYWAVNRAGEVGECRRCGRNLFVFQTCSSLALTARQPHPQAPSRNWGVPCHVVGHEIGHAALWALWVRIRDVQKSGEEVEQYLSPPLPELLLALDTPREDQKNTLLQLPDHGRDTLQELFADAYSFMLFLGADVEAYRLSVSDLAGRLPQSDEVGRAQLAYRAWVMHQCGAVFTGSAGEDRPTAAIRSYAVMPPAEQQDFLLPGFSERHAGAEALELTPDRRAEIQQEVQALWTPALKPYAGTGADDLLDSGWEQALQWKWDEAGFVRLAEMAVVLGMRLAGASLGLADGEDERPEVAKDAEAMCEAFVRYARTGAAAEIEHMWKWAMGALADRVNLTRGLS
jgi:hypothetical protein